jgi:hypothetical protein
LSNESAQAKKKFVAERMVSLIQWTGKVKLIERSNSRVERRFWQGEWSAHEAAEGIGVFYGREDCFVRFDYLAWARVRCHPLWVRCLPL